MSDKVTFSFATPSLTTLKANFIAETSGQIVRASNGSMLANNSTNRPLAAIVGAWNAGLGQYTFTMPADAPNGNYRAKIWFNPTWVDDEPDIGETNILSWDGADLTDSGEADTPADDSLTFNFELKLDGVLSDADDPPTLSDSTAVYGIKRLDTGEVVVPAGTELIHDGTGLYSYTITEPVAGVTYRAAFKYVVDGDTLYFEKEETANGAGADGSIITWRLADYDAVQSMIDSENLKIVDDLDNDGDEDLDKVQIIGNTSDADIYALARNRRVAVPFTVGGVALADLPDDNFAKLWWRKRSARWVIRDLFAHRMIQSQQGQDDAALSVSIKRIIGDLDQEIIRAASLDGIDTGIDYVAGALPVPLTSSISSVPLKFSDACMMDEFGW